MINCRARRSQSNTQQRTLLGLSYQFGPVKALAGLRWLNTRNADAPPSSLLCWGGMTWQMNAPLSISASVYHTQFRNANGGPTMGALLVDYALSKRTDVYAEGAYVANRLTTNVGIRGTGVDVVPGMDQAGVTIGIRHLF